MNLLTHYSGTNSHIGEDCERRQIVPVGFLLLRLSSIGTRA